MHDTKKFLEEIEEKSRLAALAKMQLTANGDISFWLEQLPAIEEQEYTDTERAKLLK